ncbi:MAG: hypothetical protein AB7P20_15390 [Rhizobiaceae bacterium]
MERLTDCAKNRSVSPEALAIAYIEDWLSIDYPELHGQLSRRGLHRDGPIAFDPLAAEAAARTEENLRRSGNHG